MASKRKSKPAGAMIRYGKDGRQVVRTTGKRWSAEAEQRFLDSLAASCNVRLSAAEAGFSPAAIYRRRRDDSAFARRWQAALEQGYARIEMALVRAAADSMEGIEFDADAPIPRMSAREAVVILQLHAPAVKGQGRAPGWPARPRSLDELSAGILAKFQAIEAMRGRG